MTAEGHSAMMIEVKHLKTVERPRIIKAIEEARAHGDLSENAEYHAAKEQQGWTEARVAELEDKLSRAEITAAATAAHAMPPNAMAESVSPRTSPTATGTAPAITAVTGDTIPIGPRESAA